MRQRLDQIACLLMRHLRRGRQRGFLAGQRVAGAVAQRIDIGVAGLHRIVDQQLVAARGLQAQAGQKFRRLHPGGPDTQAGRNQLAIGQLEALLGRAAHAAAHNDRDTQRLQAHPCRLGDLLGKTGQQPGAGLDQHDTELGGFTQRSVSSSTLRKLDKLCSQFNACGTTTHDGDLQRLATGHAAHHAQADFLIEGIGLATRVDHEAVLVDARRAEVIGTAAHGDDQLVIRQAPACHQLTAIGGIDGGQQDFTCLAVQTAHLARLVGEMSIAGLGQIGGLLLGQIPRSRRNGVQHGLPDMGRIAVHQRHAVYAVAAQLAQRRGHLQPGHSSTHHHNARRMGVAIPARSAGLLNIGVLGGIDGVFHEFLSGCRVWTFASSTLCRKASIDFSCISIAGNTEGT